MKSEKPRSNLLVDHICITCRHRWTTPFVMETVYCTRCYGGRVSSGSPYDPNDEVDAVSSTPEFEAAFASIFKEGQPNVRCSKCKRPFPDPMTHTGCCEYCRGTAERYTP